MGPFLIQVRRGDEWRKVTTIPIERRPHDIDQRRARALAYAEAAHQLSGWQAYDGFAGLPLRIVEPVFGAYPDRYVEARP